LAVKNNAEDGTATIEVPWVDESLAVEQTLYRGIGHQRINGIQLLFSESPADEHHQPHTIVMTVEQQVNPCSVHPSNSPSADLGPTHHLLLAALDVEKNKLKYLFLIPDTLRCQLPVVVRQSAAQAVSGQFEMLGHLSPCEVFYWRPQCFTGWYRSMKKDMKLLRLQVARDCFVAVNLDCHTTSNQETDSQFVFLSRAPASSVCQVEIYRSEERRFCESQVEFTLLGRFEVDALSCPDSNRLSVKDSHLRVYLDSALSVVGVMALVVAPDSAHLQLSMRFFSYRCQKHYLAAGRQNRLEELLIDKIVSVEAETHCSKEQLNRMKLQSVETSFYDEHSDKHYFVQVYCIVHSLLLGYHVLRQKTGSDVVDRLVDVSRFGPLTSSDCIHGLDSNLSVHRSTEDSPVAQCLVLFADGQTALLKFNLEDDCKSLNSTENKTIELI